MTSRPGRRNRIRRRFGRPRLAPRISPSIKLGSESLEPRVLLAADVVVSEIAPSGSALVDVDGDASDWIELHNVGDETVDLSSWSLTDDVRVPGKWHFPGPIEEADESGTVTKTPSITIAAGERLVVFASGKDRTDPSAALHTNFKLSTGGEYLALADADGSAVDRFDTYPAVADGLTYGRKRPESVTTYLTGTETSEYAVAAQELDAAGWTEPDFVTAEAGDWNRGTASVGYAIDPFDDLLDVYGTSAYHSSLGTRGNQAFDGRIGLDFVVEKPIAINSIGVFDDGSDGFVSRIQVELWRRDDGGTPDDGSDDTGVEVVASETLRGSRSPLIGGTRYSLLDQTLELQPGAYSIVASGFSNLDRNLVGVAGRGVTKLADTDEIRFTGSRLGKSTDDFPNVLGLGPANHYGAGSFTFVGLERDERSARGSLTAYASPSVAGNAETSGNLGLDFQVIRPIWVTDLGVFDSGQDGIQGGVGVGLWSRTTGELLVGTTFVGEAGKIDEGTGSRFIPLEDALFLSPGDYTIVASGLHGEDLFLHSDRDGGRLGTLDDGDGAIRFEGSSRYDVYGPNRFEEEPHHRLPSMQDVGPVNRWSAGTFKYEVAILDRSGTDVTEPLADTDSGLYLRIPFNAPNLEALDGLRLRASYDDGFVAYLNGVEVLRVNAPEETDWESTANSSRSDLEAVTDDVFDLSNFRALLTSDRENVLAVHLLSIGGQDPDLLFDPRLEGVAIGETVFGFFADPTPGAENGAVSRGVADGPTITTQGGIVARDRLDASGNLAVEITWASDGAEVYYTTNGSVPTSRNGKRYQEPFLIDSTSLVRAVVLRDDYLPSRIDTVSYLFLDDVLAVDGPPEGVSSHWNDEPTDYGISQDPDDLAAIAGDLSLSIEESRGVIKESLRALPTISLVTSMDDVFGLTSGFYTNPYPRGRESEHPASVEYYEADGTFGFQIDAGLRMMGWTSRIPAVNPRHSLRLLFRDEYGQGRLEYPLFEGSSITSFDTLALRANGRDTWNSDYPFGVEDWEDFEQGSMRSVASYIRDQWSRELQSDMGMMAAEGTFAHLYINGLYWGVYNPTERPDGAWAADHLGGSEDDYDSLTFCNPTTRATHGDLAVWQQMISILDDGVAGDAAYQRIFGNDPDGSRNPEYPVLLELDNFIDYMISGQYDAADDWPCNFYAFRERDQDDVGFRFTTWDNDLGLPMNQVEANRVDADLGGALESSPIRLHAALAQNSDYVTRFADRVQVHFFGDGALTPEATAARWQRIADQVAPGLVAESARWGDYRRDVDEAGPAELYTKQTHWDVALQEMLENYFPNRTDEVLDQLRDVWMYPDVSAPVASNDDGPIAPGTSVSLSSEQGTVYYTLDGSDPRDTSTNYTLLNDDSIKHIGVPVDDSLGLDWVETDFDHTGWQTTRGGVGYDFKERGDRLWSFISINMETMLTDRGTDPRQVEHPSVYIRIPFRLGDVDLDALDTLKLKMRADDGFVAYLNGQVVVESDAPANPQFDSFSTGGVSEGVAKTFRNFDLGSHVDKLVLGENVLAIHGMASDLDDLDLLFGAELIAGAGDDGVISSSAIEYNAPVTIAESAILNARVYHDGTWSPLTRRDYSTKKTLRVSEINYNPPGADETTEFIELVNVGAKDIDLTGIYFTDGIGYEFLPDDSRLELRPGEYLVIAKDPTALRNAYPEISDDLFVADRGYVGQLSNGGETITLAERDGETIQTFRYDDGWYPSTDGDGATLTIVDALADRSRWNHGDGWMASDVIGGSPGSGPTIVRSTAAPPVSRPSQISSTLRRQHADQNVRVDDIAFAAPADPPADDAISRGGLLAWSYPVSNAEAASVLPQGTIVTKSDRRSVGERPATWTNRERASALAGIHDEVFRHWWRSLVDGD